MFIVRESLKSRIALYVLVVLVAMCRMAAAQSNKGSISGLVIDNSGAALSGARVELLPLGLVSVSGNQGGFAFPGIVAGRYTLSVSYVGFKPTQKDVELAAGQTLNTPLTLSVSSVSDEVLVTAERPHGEAEAINQTRTADNIVQVLPNEVIMSLPNANVADAIGRLPSVSLYRIEGEGVYIQVRGTEPRLTNVTVDGITIPSPEPTVRQVRLDVLPADLVEAVELNKTLSANQDANGIGGSVNLRTKEASEQPTLNAWGNGGYNPIANGRASYGTGATVGKRFGVTKKFGLLGNGAFDYNGRGIDNIQPSLDPLSTFARPFYDNDTIREYRYYRYRYGFAGSTDYRINDDASVYARGTFSDFKDWGDKWYYSPVSTAISSNGTLPSPAAASPAPKFYTSSKRPNASVGALIAGGRDATVNTLTTVELSASRSYEVSSAGNPKADFSWVGPSVNCNYDPSAQTNINRPRFGACDGPNSTLQNSQYWIFKDITMSRGLTSQLNLTGAVSHARNYEVASHFGTFEAGFKFTNAHKTQNATETVYDGWSTKAGSSTPTMAQLQGNFSSTNFYDNSYFGGKYGPVSDFNLVQDYTLKNFSGYVDQQKTAAATWPNIFHTIERITAGYAMNIITFGKLRAQTGVRFEATHMNTAGYNLTFYGPSTATQACGSVPYKNCWTVHGVSNSPSYLDVLPSVQLRYALTPNSALRAVYARGVARPDAYQLVPYVLEDSTASPTAVTVGNPALKPTRANNYDLLYENYLNPLGMIQAGVFFKQLNSPQLLTSIPGGLDLSNFPPGYFPVSLQSVIAQYPGDAVTQYVNGQNAWLYGFEVSYQQRLSYLPGVLRGLGISANYSYTKSREKGLPLRTDQPTLIDQSPNNFNLSSTYDTKRLSMRVGLAYNGASLLSYNWIAPSLVKGADPSNLGPTGPSGDVYTLTHFQVDAQASYRVYRGWSAVVSGLNLNNEVFGYYTGSTQFVNQREYYKPTISGGVRYSFQASK